jgi:hypothetical protein
MTPEQTFSILNTATMAAWLSLILLPQVRWVTRIVPFAVSLILGILYIALVAAAAGRIEGGFSTLAGVRTLFQNDWMLLAGWTHYLAFDLFIGGWELRDAQRRGIRHVFVVPALILTFLLGPAGLVLYLMIRSARDLQSRAVVQVTAE